MNKSVPTNDERAEHAGNAIVEYLSSKGDHHDEPAEETDLSDLIADIFHHAERHEFDIDRIIRVARMHYEDERST